jgi:spermidine synthase
MAKTDRTDRATAQPAFTGNIRLAHALLGLICFISGAAVMVIEISANRLMSPLFGNSVYTWTALIGVVLVCFSVGGYLGGWLTDKKADFALLGRLLAGSGVMTLFIPQLFTIFGPANENSGLIMGPLIVSSLLLAVPGVLLGAVSPASVRLYSALQKDAHVGQAAGTISMLGSLGSFVGTFLSGFYLLSAFGVKAIFIGSGLLLILLASAAFYLARNKLMDHVPVWISGLLAAVIGGSAELKAAENVLFQAESVYHRVQVTQTGTGALAQRFLQLDSTMEGGMEAETGDLILEYQHYWQVPMLREDFQMKRALFLGAGAFGMPEQVSKQWPEAKVDVVEIDPVVIEVGHKFFKLSEFPNVMAHAGDARRFVRQSTEQYDLIFGDAYNGVQAIPVHLATREFFAEVKSRLSPQGLFVMNVISAVEGPRAELLAGMLATLREVFPHVALCAVGGVRTTSQNTILVASAEDWEPLFMRSDYPTGSWQDRLTSRFVPEFRRPQKGAVFTDDHNPVDAIIARGLRSY